MQDEELKQDGGTPDTEVETPTETEAVNEVPQEPVEKKSEDRSEFNCPDCKGEGINVETNVVCGKCGGTGKV